VIEHVISRPSGNNSYRNVVAACRDCNNRKGNSEAEDFLRVLFRERFLSNDEFEQRLSHLQRLQAGELRPTLPGFSGTAIATIAEAPPEDCNGGTALWDDPIVAEVRKAREELLAEFNGDLAAMVKDIQAEAIARGVKFISFPPRRVSPAEQEAARIRLQQILEEEAKSSGTAPKPETSDSRLAG
jgi:HNH endonuclease